MHISKTGLLGKAVFLSAILHGEDNGINIYFLVMKDLLKPRLAYVFISAVVGIVIFLPFNLYFLSFIFLVPFFYFLYAEKRFWMLLLGVFVFRLVLMLGTVYYTLEPIVWASSLFIFSLLAVMVFILSKLLNKFSYAKIVCIPLAFLAFDILAARYTLLPTYIITAGNMLGSSPFAGLAKYGGLLALELYIILTNTFFLIIFLNRRRLIEKKKELVFATAGLVLSLLGAFMLSNYFLAQNSRALAAHKNSLRITVVSLKKDFSQADLRRLVADISLIETDLIVLPEELFVKPEDNPFSVNESAAIMGNINARARYLVGTFHTLKQGKNYNTAILIDSAGEIIDQYDKNKLTILGEYWPFVWHPSMYNFLKNNPTTKNYAIVDPSNSYMAGSAKTLQITKDGVTVPFGALICLEGHYYSMWSTYRKSGAKFVISPISNRWIAIGSNHFSYLVANLYNINSIQSGLPIMVSGINNFAGSFSPDGKRRIVKYGDTEKYIITTQQVTF